MALNLVSEQMKKALQEADREIKTKVNTAVDSVAKESVNKLRDSSPARPGHGEYAKSWTIKRERSRSGINDVTIHNRDHYRLTHLLEKGHIIRNAKGTYGRTNPIKHIEPVEEFFNSEIPAQIERELE